jgi:hypothetical protein
MVGSSAITLDEASEVSLPAGRVAEQLVDTYCVQVEVEKFDGSSGYPEQCQLRSAVSAAAGVSITSVSPG